MTSGSALATTGHAFADSFGGPGAEEGKFSPSPAGVGVGLSGEVFVADEAVDPNTASPHPRVQRFDSAEVFQASFPIEGLSSLSTVAVDSAPAGGVYVTAVSSETGVPVVAKYSSAGLFEYDLNAEGSETSTNYGVVAVDPANGTVYTTATNPNTGAQFVDSFSQTTGAFIASFNGESGSPDGPFLCPTGLASDSSHRVYVLDPCKGAGRVDAYSAAGGYEATVDDGGRGAPQKVANNPETGEAYVAEAGPSGLQVTNFTAGGTSATQTFSVSKDEGPTGMAVGPDGTVYMGDSTNSVVDRFTAFDGPTVATGAASEVERTSAILNGTVNAESIATEYHYEYGLKEAYGKTTETVDAGSGNTTNAAPAAITGLVPNTTYHYRVVGTNTSGSIVGADETFTTAAAPPAVGDSPTFVTTISPTGARVHATVNPEHSLTTFRIEYGTTAAYGSSTPQGGAEVGEQSADTPVATNLTGLESGTVYHYRASAENGVEGPQTGVDGTFITAPGAPATGSELTTAKATLTGTINPHGVASTYHFNYGPSIAYGASTPDVSGGSGEGDEEVAERITGLSPGSTYHVQVVATTNGLTYSGADGTFTTAPAPVATVTDPTAVTSSSATLEGAADTHGLAGSYHFEIAALDGSYSANSSEQPLAAATGAQAVSTPAARLAAGETFHARLVVSSNEATGYSSQVTFSTPGVADGSVPEATGAGGGVRLHCTETEPVQRQGQTGVVDHDHRLRPGAERERAAGRRNPQPDGLVRDRVHDRSPGRRARRAWADGELRGRIEHSRDRDDGLTS